MKRDLIFVSIIVVVFILLGVGLKINQKRKCEVALDTSIQAANEQIEEVQGFKVTLIGGTNMRDLGNINSMGYVIRTRNNKLIIVDGGRKEDSEFVLNYINKYGNGKVDYWFITHAHIDHVGALLKLLDEENIEVENLCYSFLTDDWYKKYDERGYESEHEMLEKLSNEKIKNKIEGEKGKIIDIDNLKCEILRVADPTVTGSDNGNEASMVFKFTATDVDKSILFLGDSFNKVSKELLEEPEKLECYAVQMAHHGQNGVTKEVYDAINPKVCFYNCPKWLFDNDKGDGFDTGTLKTVIVRGWMEEKNVISFMAFDGDQTIKFTKDGFEKVEE